MSEAEVARPQSKNTITELSAVLSAGGMTQNLVSGRVVAMKSSIHTTAGERRRGRR